MDDLLALDPAVFSHHTVDANGIKLHYVRGGSGPVMLLLHGFLATWYAWRKVMPALAKNYTLIVPDMRGYGDSDKPENGYDTQTFVDDFRELLQLIGVDEKIIIVGHDMGAPPALVYAGEYPDEVRALVYFECPILIPENMQKLHAFTPQGCDKGGLWWWKFAFATDMPERLIVGAERAFLTWFYQRSSHDKGASIEDAAVTEYLRTFSGKEGIRGSFGIYREIFKCIEQTEKFATSEGKINTPVLALGGEMGLGKLVKPMVEGVANNVTGGVIDNCGHFIQEEQPDILIQKINEFIDGLAE